MFELFVVALMLLLTVGGGLLLYAMVDAEKNERRVMDRESAERVARRDTDTRGSDETDPSAPPNNDLDASGNAERGNHWGSDRDEK
ncbi:MULTISPECIES: hypothetical protein [Halorussus]|uniref:hypothetical protein n=1 Tax=Halorussus TaxID=1070314 RepID=UPI000E20DAA6|nr:MULTISPECIES: hypothetical protein [Halorussus]NHN58792.1 hypothetical protein [Halorussus sp. JP-T4]